MNREHSLKTALDECVRFEDEVRAEMLSERTRAEAAEARAARVEAALRNSGGIRDDGLWHGAECPGVPAFECACAERRAALADSGEA